MSPAQVNVFLKTVHPTLVGGGPLSSFRVPHLATTVVQLSLSSKKQLEYFCSEFMLSCNFSFFLYSFTKKKGSGPKNFKQNMS